MAVNYDEVPAKAHSPRYADVKLYSDAGVWNGQMVKNAVGKWITADEASEILGGDKS